jgi:hypothetical protein
MTRLFFAIDGALAALTIESNDVGCDLHLAGNGISCVAVDPLRPEHMYCGTFGSGLWRSDDAGGHWQPAGRGIRHSTIQSVAVSRCERKNDRGVVYSGTEPSAIFRYEDTGENWRECGDFNEASLRQAMEFSAPSGDASRSMDRVRSSRRGTTICGHRSRSLRPICPF